MVEIIIFISYSVLTYSRTSIYQTPSGPRQASPEKRWRLNRGWARVSWEINQVIKKSESAAVIISSGWILYTQKMPMAALGLIILEMKADNELAISLLVYFKSVKKMKICVKKKKNKKNDLNKKNSKKKFLMASGSWTLDPQRVRYCATTTIVEQNRWIFYRYHFCPWNSASGRCLKLVEPYLWRIERYIRGKQAWFGRLSKPLRSHLLTALYSLHFSALTWEESVMIQQQ